MTATPGTLIELRPDQVEALEHMSRMTDIPVDTIVQMATDDLIRGFARGLITMMLTGEI